MPERSVSGLVEERRHVIERIVEYEGLPKRERERLARSYGELRKRSAELRDEIKRRGAWVENETQLDRIEAKLDRILDYIGGAS